MKDYFIIIFKETPNYPRVALGFATQTKVDIHTLSSPLRQFYPKYSESKSCSHCRYHKNMCGNKRIQQCEEGCRIFDSPPLNQYYYEKN